MVGITLPLLYRLQRRNFSYRVKMMGKRKAFQCLPVPSATVIMQTSAPVQAVGDGH